MNRNNKNFTLIVVAVLTIIVLSAAAAVYFFDQKEPDAMKQSAAESKPSAIEPEELPQDESGEESAEAALPEGFLTDWNMILLNPEAENKIDEDLILLDPSDSQTDDGRYLKLVEFDGQSVDSRAAGDYEAMRTAAKNAGITLFLRSGYRSMKTQEYNYNASIENKMSAGMSREEAVAATNQYYTVPGHSEHHTGLAFDIITPDYHQNVYELDDRFAETEAYAWLIQNCAEYGFILRYPKEKEDITQISFEPWHYRYVGADHAKVIMTQGLCLEEYVALLKQNAR